MLKQATLIGLGLVVCAFGQTAGLVRDEVRVSGETWRLEWKKPPVASCGAWEEDLFYCPCAGFAYGQSGDLEIVRERVGKVVQRLDLGQFFEGRIARVQLREQRSGDIDKISTVLSQEVANRPVTRVMRLADYNHDGRATEFLLQTSAGPCGWLQGIVIGITAANPELHAFGTVAHPKEPLVMKLGEWEKVRASKGRAHTVWLTCGDHGAEEQVERTITTSAKGIEVEELTYGCTEKDARGKLLGTVKR